MGLNFDLGDMLSPDYQDPSAIVPLHGVCNPNGSEPSSGQCIVLGSSPSGGECETGCGPKNQLCLLGFNQCVGGIGA